MSILSTKLARTGRFPNVALEIKPLNGTRSVRFDKFTQYQFASNMLVPVDAFSFQFTAPGDPNPFTAYVQEGDIAVLLADEKIVATGIVDQIEIEVDADNGERASVVGRDLLGQLEDNSAVSIDKAPIWGQSITVENAAKKLVEGTRIQTVKTSEAPQTAVLFASEPGESRLSALLRMCEPLNVLVWTEATGTLVVGRPAFASAPQGNIICNRRKRESNVFSIRATYAATSIPNTVVVLWSDVQSTLQGIPQNQIFNNAAAGPSRLRQRGHNVIKTTMTSYPSGGDAQSLAAAAQFQTADAANQTILQALAKRELARANFSELLVHCVVPGHFNEKGEIYRPDTTYIVDFDRAGIQEKMYLYAVEWNLSEERGQYTVLNFCRLGTMVSDARIK